MHRYFIKTPWWVSRLFSSYVWHIPTAGKVVYLTFDDGPHPTITPWVLDQLKQYSASATFFCIGKNVVQFPEVYNRVLQDGHSIGNHTHHHLNGWKTSVNSYLADVEAASAVIQTNLFRPPYGKITFMQAKGLVKAMKTNNAKVIMWDVLSADFDKTISPEQCAKNVMQNVSSGSVVVFHDSEKAFDNLKIALPAVLRFLKEEGYSLDRIAMETP